MLEFNQNHKVADTSSIRHKLVKSGGKVLLCGILISSILSFKTSISKISLKKETSFLFISLFGCLGNVYLKYLENISFCIGKFSAAEAPAPKKIHIFIISTP